ncbi:IS21 family transposase [[Mycobacterium] zoologicum]|uniref:IS21 family transposase n=1 Tax=[Mycobacterium] zoologicum TaxID=2872311 RepID=UPI002C4308F3|nr:IS21 family transposase [Mycolicibacter sp. MYC101]MEB3065762.1 IS21 family transposase [Mycolicibacter sp. MYC101]
MVDYKQILRLRAEGVSQRGIADALGCSRNTVAAVFAAANTAGVGFGQVADLEAFEVRRLLLPEPTKPDSDRAAPDFEHVHRELARPSVTLLLLWNEYVAKCRDGGEVPYRYSFFNEQYRRWVKSTGASMRIARDPGESIEVDWAGDAMSFVDPLTGEPCAAWLFVAALSYSAYTYVEAFADMTLASWIDAHVHAFEAFGGVARLLVPDNLRTGVSKADRYEPALNAAYARMAEHYGTAIIPARVKRPRDKPVAEGSVRFVANQVAAVLRNRRFVGLAELNEAIFGEVAEINARPFQKREDSRHIVFVRDEKPLLIPLPHIGFELADLRKAKVGPNYHVQVDKNFYSVPAKLIGQSVDVRITSHTVEIFDGTDRVASHPRRNGVRGRYCTMTAHMPEAHRSRLVDWTPQRFEQWAATVGPNTVATITAILASRKIVEQSYRSCLGVMSLAKKPGGMARLEDTCGAALAATPSPSYTLIKKLWAGWKPADPPPPPSLGDAGFVRGADYYSADGGQS